MGGGKGRSGICFALNTGVSKPLASNVHTCAETPKYHANLDTVYPPSTSLVPNDGSPVHIPLVRVVSKTNCAASTTLFVGDCRDHH